MAAEKCYAQPAGDDLRARHPHVRDGHAQHPGHHPASLLKQWTHLPIFGDPSHGTGRWEIIAPVAKACLAAGADGVMIEVHPHPAEAMSDGAQSLKPEKFAALVRELKMLAPALGRTM